MSNTKGGIAVGTESKWSGLYNHSDSYPTSLGRNLWDTISEKGLNTVVNEIKRKINPTDGVKEDIELSEKEKNPLFIEWIYVINPEKKIISILVSVRKKGTHKERGVEGEYEAPNYEHELIDTYKLTDPPPNWEQVEKLGNVMKDFADQKYEIRKMRA